MGKTFKLSQSQRCIEKPFLFAAEGFSRRFDAFIKCKIVDKESNKTQPTKNIVELMKEFEDKSHLLTARSLSDMIDDVVWFRVPDPTLEQKEFIKMRESHLRRALKKISRIQQNNSDKKTKHRDELDFEKRLNASSMSLSCEKMTKVRSFCNKYDIIFSRNSIFM